jgi:peptide/nickel transport system substrate-binding protein
MLSPRLSASLILVPLLALCALSAPSWAQSEAAEPLIREAAYRFPATLDPHRAFDPWWAPMFRLGYETPLVCDPQAESLVLRPALLEALPELDEETGLRLSLRLRKGPRFIDDPCFEKGKGRVMRARDLAFIFQRHADPASQSPLWEAYFAGRFVGLDEARARAEKEGVFDYRAAIPGVEIVSDRELRLHLRQPYPQLLALMTMPWFSVVPPEALRRYGSGLGSRTVGSGPYVFDAKTSGPKSWIFRARADYWGGPPPNAGVRFDLVPEVEEQNKRFRAGDIDFLDLYPQNRPEFVNAAHEIRSGIAASGARIARTDAVRLHYLAFGMKNLFLKQSSVRRALTLALDREDYLKRFHRGNASLPNHLVPPSLALDIKDGAKSLSWAEGRRDLDKARKLLAAAGYPGGKGLPEFRVDIPYRGEAAEREFRLLQRSWRPLGLKLRAVYHDLPSFQKQMREKACEIAVSYWYADYPDAENFFLIMSSTASPELDLNGHAPNHGSYAQPRYDTLYRESCRLLPGPKRGDLYREMIKILQRDCPIVPIAHLREETVVGGRVARMCNRSRYAFDYGRVSLKK